MIELNPLALATAIGGGFLIGIERERRKGHGANRALAGVRTFTLAAIAGAIAEHIRQPWLVGGGAVLILALTAVAYWKDRSSDPGVTTELALFVTYLLGVAAVDHPATAAAGYVLVAGLLASRSRLHRFSTDVLSSRELNDALVLAGAALVILPLVPDTTLVWLGGLNPRRVWTLAVVIMGLEAAGYVGMRTVGAVKGLAVSGFSSGFISSTATIAILGARARRQPALVRACVAGGLFSTIATFVQLGVITAASHPPSLPGLLRPLVAGLIATLAAAVLALPRPHGRAARVPRRAHAFDLRRAVSVAAFLAGITVAVGLAHERLGRRAALASAAIAGFADVHSATAAVLSLAASGHVEGPLLRTAILVALTTNTCSKLLAAWWSGGTSYALRVAPGLLLGTAAAWIGNRLA